ncbi:MAG TPA: hypothetical protein VGI95_03665 [Caulobacteraceae bacterium]|jgi:hypothetical protein
MPLRIIKATDGKAAIAPQPPTPAPPTPSAQAPDGYLSRLAKLIPAEALSLYGTGVGMISADASWRETGVRAVAVVCVLLSMGLRYKLTQGPDGRPQWRALAVSLVAFLFWLAALGDQTSPFLLTAGARQAVALAAFLFTAVLPYIYKGDT